MQLGSSCVHGVELERESSATIVRPPRSNASVNTNPEP